MSKQLKKKKLPIKTCYILGDLVLLSILKIRSRSEVFHKLIDMGKF